MSENRRILLELFGASYRAEWRRDVFRELFISPPYFEKLELSAPCILFGGRGTGKTTALRSLRFDAAHARLGAPTSLPYLAIYIRINKNRVRAFEGAGKQPSEWRRTFAHYFNLLAVQEFVRLYIWLIDNEGWPAPRPESIRRIANGAALTSVDSLLGLLSSIQDGLVALELYVNNQAAGTPPMQSMPESPLRDFVQLLADSGRLNERAIFCCIDEYENLLEYQQATLNTYVKHSEPPLSYKIGARRQGLRTRHTTDEQDLLVTPDDYLEVDISTESFSSFAIDVATRRLSQARQRGATVSNNLDDVLPGLSRREEAALLGASDVAHQVLEKVRVECSAEIMSWARAQPEEDLVVLAYCAKGEGQSIEELAREAQGSAEKWKARINNYGYSSLFWLSKGRKGTRIRKHYAGASVFLGLASGNIRYFLELIDTSLCVKFGADLAPEGPVVVSAKDQTLAARTVAKRRLDMLEGLGEQGFALKRLVLGVGKVFFEMARDPVGRAPEVTSFVLAGDLRAKAELEALLREGVAQLAFEAFPRTKATSDAEVRDDEYRLHPIYCPFFEFSHRKKRRTTFRSELLLALARPGGKEGPSQVLSKLLEGRAQETPDELPEQMGMFAAFYSGVGDA